MLRLLLCVECGLKWLDEHPEHVKKTDGIFLAAEGPQGSTEEDDNILICATLKSLHPSLIPDQIAQEMCEGGCGKLLTVHKSSQWFMDEREYHQPKTLH